MNSIWTEYPGMPHFPVLEGDVRTDVLIIGGGITGILCAHFLQEQGVDYVLAEGGNICSGITKNTTAKITSQHGLVYHKILKSEGVERASMYLHANQKALETYAKLCRNIDCDFQRKNSYVYSLDNPGKLEKEAQALEKIGFSPLVEVDTELPIQMAGAIGFEDQAQFHPLKFLAEIAKELKIYEHTFVKELKEKAAVTEYGEITFQKAIFATHFPINNKFGLYFLKLYQHRSHVIALKNAVKLNGMYVDDAKGGLSFRNYGEYLLLGGGGHRTGKRGGNWQVLREFAEEHYPEAEEAGCWAAQDCMSLDSIPYIGRYSPSEHMPDCYVATGFNKWGMTSSMVAAGILTDMVMEKENPYQAAFDPARSIIKPQLILNVLEALKNLLTISKRRCPHMGCALKWNAAEHSWDCPCHGSRFSEDGRRLDNPANGDLPEENGSII